MKPIVFIQLLLIIGTAFVISAKAQNNSSKTDINEPSKFFSAEDGWPDISGFTDQAYGFVPIAIPITEPAVGYGVAAGLAFIDKPQNKAQAGFGRPNITAIGGLVTENGTSGVFAADSRYWLNDKLQTLVAGVYASVNLDFYGIGEEDILKNNPLTYNLEPIGGLAQVKYRLGASRYWAGLSYAYASTQIEFDAPDSTPGIPDFEDVSNVGGLTPSLTYDSRDTIFTPTNGTYFDTSAGLFSQALGGDDEFQRVNLIGMHYMPLNSKFTLGVRGDAMLSFGDVPFYMRPFVTLRGTQAMRYQGDEIAQAEAELRWQFWERFSLVGFVGGGATWNDFEQFDNSVTVLTGGTGFRYELARKYGLHIGFDVAFGPDETIFYVQFGSAWMRP